MAANEITVSIALKPYLRKYLLYHSENKQEPVRFPRKHDYNLLLVRLVTNYNRLTSLPIEDRESVLSHFRPSTESRSNEVRIVLPYNERKDIRYYNYLSAAGKHRFRREVWNDFMFDFNRYLIANLRRKKQRLVIVNEFKELFGLTEDDIKTESLYRQSSRILRELSEN